MFTQLALEAAQHFCQDKQLILKPVGKDKKLSDFQII
jgi:hypothetical protein